ncbi:MAG TPA: PIN domain-containing protein [Blastocatellia bacterium]|nr:PIN domain-containing protein [Blastocatellia bacterium]
MSIYVTDTHPLIWYAANQKAKLSKKALRIFEKASANQTLIYVPTPVLWEIALLIKAGQIRLPQPFAQWAAALSSQLGFEIVLLDAAVLETTLNVRVNGDPFDEVIVATALALDPRGRPIHSSNAKQPDSRPPLHALVRRLAISAFLF